MATVLPPAHRKTGFLVGKEAAGQFNPFIANIWTGGEGVIYQRGLFAHVVFCQSMVG